MAFVDINKHAHTHTHTQMKNYWQQLLNEEPYKEGRRYQRLLKRLQEYEVEIAEKQKRYIELIDKVLQNLKCTDLSYIHRCLALLSSEEIAECKSEDEIIRKAHQKHNHAIITASTIRFRHNHTFNRSFICCKVIGNAKRCECSCKCPIEDSVIHLSFDWSDRSKFNLDSTKFVGRIACGWCHCQDWRKCVYCKDFYVLNANIAISMFF